MASFASWRSAAILFMKNKRLELLQNLIKKLTGAVQMMHRGQCLSFEGLALRKQEMMILFFIYENQGVSSVKDIAKFLNVTSGAVTQFTDGLVEKKLVKREASLVDRRSVNIKLAGNVKKEFGRFKKKYLESASLAFSGLSDKELEQFIELAGKIKAAN